MENATAIRWSAPKRNAHPLRINQQTYHVIEGIFLALSAYIFTSILFCLLKPYFEKVCSRKSRSKLNKSKNIANDSNSSFEDAATTRAISGIRRENKRTRQRAALIMMSLTLTMSLIVLLRVAVDLWAYLEKNSFSKKVQCIRHTVSGLLYISSALCLYVFLWIRQRTFYAHPVLKHLARPGIVRFSWSVLATIVVVILFSTTMFFMPQLAPVTRDDIHNGTVTQNRTGVVIDFAGYGVVPIECGFQRKTVFLGAHFMITISFLYFQMSLQFLFGYPIFKQRRRKTRYNDAQRLTEQSNRYSKIETANYIPNGHSSAPCFSRMTSVPGRTPNSERIETSCQLSQTDFGDGKAMFSSTPNLAQSRNDPLLTDNHHDATNVSGTAQTRELNDHRSTRMVAHIARNGSQQNSAPVSDAFNRISTAFSGINLKDIKRIPKSISKVTERSRKSFQRRMELRKYVMRCLCVSAFCSISDIATFLFIYFSQFREYFIIRYVALSAVSESMITSLAYNANIMLNLLCMIACYKDWRQKLCPWYYLVKKFTRGRKS